MSHLQPLITIIATLSAGILCIIIAERVKLPSILFLLITGVCLGPHGINLIQPSVFKDELPQYITILVALILFEGGTSLKFNQLKEISGTIRRLLGTGMLITLITASLGAHWILNMSWIKSILFGSVLIVTGPTVVQPILQRIKVKEKVHNILKWESILIDPLGVILAIVLSEILLIDYIGPLEGLGMLTARITIGLILGFSAGRILFLFLSRPSLLRFESEELSGIFVLAINLLFYGISESILSESGLVTVTVAGIVFGNMKLANIEHILRFKKQLTLIALSTIFILLSAHIPMNKVYGIIPEGSVFLLYLIFVVRPLSVFLSTIKETALSSRERLFICFFAPRGIVSAVLASLLTILFEEKELIGRGTFLPLAFYIIAGSIIFYALTGRLTARLLNLIEETGKSVLIIGASQPAILLAKALKDCGFPVIFIDTNPDLCQEMRSKGFEAHYGSGTDRNFIETLDIKGVHQMLAATPNHEANVLACQLMAGYLGKKSVFRLWDKSDSWENAASSHHETWGRPFILPSHLQEKGNGTKWTIEREVLPKATLINEEFFKIRQNIPFFAVSRESLLFLTPHTTIPQGSELLTLSSTSK